MEKASPFPSEIGDAFRKGSENVPTLRFTLSLPASDDKTCPEYSFLDLVKSATRKSGETSEKTPWDDEDGDDEKLRALAKKFEQKYAPKPTSKKRRRDRMEDLIDVTYGYDETDPFVDDSEAYDELLPADWTTEHGGFYINQGALNFRPVSPGGESEEDEGDFQKPKKLKLKSPKKMPKVPKVKKVKVPGEKKERKKSGDKEKKPRKSSSSEKEKEKKEKKHKKRLSLGNANIVNMLSSPSSSAKNTSATVSSNMALTTGGSQGTNNVTVNSSSPQKVQNSLQQSNQGIVKTEPGMVNGSSSAVTTEENASVAKSDSLLSSTLQNGISAGEASSSEIAEPSLPQCLPTDVEACIMRLKQAGTNGITEGKCKFFNSDVNHMLLELETKSRALSSKVRSGIYEFLAFYLPCTKETLLKRAKNLLLNDQAGRLREPMAKLKAAVDRVIPEQIKRFEEEVRQHVEEESKKQGGQKQDGENPDDHKKELFKSAMEVVEDSEKSDEITTPTDPNAPSHSEDKAKKNTPKRKFIWTEELRGLLCDVVQMKMKIFQMSKTRAQSAEEYLKAFFENEVRPLWPKGWMTSRILLRESKTVHGKYTSVPARIPKKAPGPKKQGESPENQDSNAGGNPVAKVLPSSNSLVVNIGSSSVTTAKPALSAATVTPAISALKNLVQSGQAGNIKTAAPVIHSTVATSVPKPVVSTATATKMESTTVNRPELTLQIVPIITDLKLNKKDTASKSSSANRSLGSDCVAKKDNASKPPNPSLLLESPKSKTPVTILDFADMISPEGQADTSKLLHSQQSIPAKQQLASFLNKTPSPTKEKPKDQPLTHLPSSVVTTAVSHPAQSSTVSPARTQTALTSPPKVVRSSPVTIPSVNQSVLLAATVGNLTAAGLPNNFIDLASLRQQPRPAVDLASSLMQQQKAAADLASSLMQQQQQQQQLKAAVDLASTLRQQQQQQKAAVTAGGTPPSQAVLESITSPRRSSVDLKSCQTVLPGFTPHQGMSPQSIAMSLSSSMPSQAMHQAQPPNLTLFGSAGNLQAGKVTTPLTHLGIAPHTLQSAMLHLSRQTQEQSGIVLPQNHFNNQVLLGMNPTSTQSLPSLQLPHAALLSNQPVYQDPNQTSSTGTHPSQFLPRFS